MGHQYLLQIDPHEFNNRDILKLTSEEIIEWLEEAGAVWKYQGEPSPDKPHARLSWGLCCGEYYYVLRLLKFPNINEIVGRKIAQQLRNEDIGRVDFVVSSQYSAALLGYEVAKALGACFLSPEKDPCDPSGKRMLWRRQKIPPWARALQIEETVVTMGTIEEVQRAINEGNGAPVDFLPEVGVLVFRPPEISSLLHGGRKIVAPVRLKIPVFQPGKDCPYCAVGSPTYEPKAYWKQLTGEE